MRKLFVLLRVNFSSLLQVFSFGRSKKRKVSGLGALLFLCFIALYLSGVYSFLMVDLLASVGVEAFFLPLMTLYAAFMALMFSVYAAGGLLFGGKDNDFVLSLPVSPFTVLLSRILALYVENLVFVIMWMLPTAFVYFLRLAPITVMGILGMVLICLFLPLLVVLLDIALGFILTYVSSKFKRQALLSAVLYFALFGVIMVLAMQINQLPLFLLASQDSVMQVLHTWLLPFGLLSDMVSGSIPAAIGFVAVCSLPVLAVTYGISFCYKKLLTSLSTHHTRTDYKLGQVAAQGQLSALLKKEMRRYFGTTIYFFNTGFGLIMLVGATIYACVAKATVMPIVEMLGGTAQVLPLLLLGTCCLVATANTTCVSISLEGKTLWILKEAPLSPALLFGAKAGFNVLLVYPLTLVCLVVVGVAYAIPMADVLCMLVFFLLFTIFIALFGLAVNLLLPKMDAANDTLVIKQSASALVGILGPWIPLAVGAFLYGAVKDVIGFRGFALAASVVALGVSLLVWQFLKTKGVRRLLSL